MKILKITEKIPQPAVLPDGLYNGVLGGSIIQLSYNAKYYELTVEEGIRGSGVKVVVTVKNGEATYDEFKN